MTEALIGLAGILIGLLLNEHFRRSNRIEAYSSKVFEKRLEIYEKLIVLVSEKSSLVTNVIKSIGVEEEITEEIANDICFNAGLKVVEFCDSNQLYLNEEITVHLCATFVGTGDIISKEKESKKVLIQRFNLDIKEAKKMIKVESGLSELDGLFEKITKAKHSSPVIEYFRELKKNKV